MAGMRFITLLILVVLVYYLLTAMFGIAGGLVAILGTVAIIGLLKYFNVGFAGAFPLNRKVSGYVAVIGLIIVAFMSGWLTFLNIPGAVVSPAAVPVVTTGACSVSGELAGKQSTVTINAYDTEADSQSEIASACGIYNSNTGTKYQDISSYGSASTFTIAAGTQVDIYCANNTANYGTPVLGVCINQLDQTIEVDVATIQAEASLAITGYDDTATTALTAGDINDYKTSMGASEIKTIYVKLKNNAANKAFDFCAWGVKALTNITYIKPIESGFSQVGTPLHMQDVSLQINASNSAPTRDIDYVVYKASTVTRLSEWESLKHQFEIKSSSNDPVDAWTQCRDNTKTTCAGVAVLAKDCQWQENTAGNMVYDFYAHTDTETDVGLDETDASPAGKTTGVLIEID